MAYTKEEIEQFRKKDKRISMQGLVQILLATGANIHEVKENVALAKKYSDEIWNTVDEITAKEPVERSPTGTVETSIIPKPTADQVPVLKAVMEQTGLSKDDVCIGVLDYSTNVLHKTVPTYPTNMGSVGKIVDYLNERK